MINETKIRNSFSRIKVDIDLLKDSIYDIRNNINHLKQNQEYLYNEMLKKDRDLAYEIKWLRERISNLENQLQQERSLRH